MPTDSEEFEILEVKLPLEVYAKLFGEDATLKRYKEQYEKSS